LCLVISKTGKADRRARFSAEYDGFSRVAEMSQFEVKRIA